MDWYLAVLKKYAVFDGRARRKEYWMFTLITFIVAFVLGIVDGVIGARSHQGGIGVFGGLYTLATFLPGLAVTIRRLHDTGRSGWWALLILLPVIGWLVLLLFEVQDSQPGDNQYGPNPKQGVSTAVY